MKIRTGFVSNSSSSSFCLYGDKINFYDECENDEEFMEKLQEIVDKKFDWEKLSALFKKSVKPNVFDGCKESSIILKVDWEQQCLVIGRSYLSLGDEETGDEFKESATKIVTHIIKELNRNSKIKIDEHRELDKFITEVQS